MKLTTFAVHEGKGDDEVTSLCKKRRHRDTSPSVDDKDANGSSNIDSESDGGLNEGELVGKPRRKTRSKSKKTR